MFIINEAICVNWLAKKQFIVSYDNLVDNQPLYEFLEIISDKVNIINNLLHFILFSSFKPFKFEKIKTANSK